MRSKPICFSTYREMLKASDVWFHPSPRLAKPVTVGHAGGCGKVQFDALSFKLGPWWERLL